MVRVYMTQPPQIQSVNTPPALYPAGRFLFGSPNSKFRPIPSRNTQQEAFFLVSMLTPNMNTQQEAIQFLVDIFEKTPSRTVLTTQQEANTQQEVSFPLIFL